MMRESFNSSWKDEESALTVLKMPMPLGMVIDDVQDLEGRKEGQLEDEAQIETKLSKDNRLRRWRGILIAGTADNLENHSEFGVSGDLEESQWSIFFRGLLTDQPSLIKASRFRQRVGFRRTALFALSCGPEIIPGSKQGKV